MAAAKTAKEKKKDRVNRFKTINPKSEYRNPKQIRNPKVQMF